MLFVSIELGSAPSLAISFEVVSAITKRAAIQSQSHFTGTRDTSYAHYQLRQAFRFLTPVIS